MRHVIADRELRAGQAFRLRRRSWTERLLSWPWRPWIALAAEPCEVEYT